MSKKVKIALSILGVMILAVPLGLLATGDAWGEWDFTYYKEKLGFIPKGMQSFPNLQHPLLPDYSVPGLGDVMGYYISAVIGAILIFIIWFIIGKIIAKKHSNN